MTAGVVGGLLLLSASCSLAPATALPPGLSSSARVPHFLHQTLFPAPVRPHHVQSPSVILCGALLTESCEPLHCVPHRGHELLSAPGLYSLLQTRLIGQSDDSAFVQRMRATHRSRAKALMPPRPRTRAPLRRQTRRAARQLGSLRVTAAARPTAAVRTAAAAVAMALTAQHPVPSRKVPCEASGWAAASVYPML